MRLIDADIFEVVPLGDVSDEFVEGARFILEMIDDTPTIETKPVVHGRWIMGVDIADYEYGVCSVCGYEERDAFPCGRTPKYCSECGAKMDVLHTSMEGRDE